MFIGFVMEMFSIEVLHMINLIVCLFLCGQLWRITENSFQFRVFNKQFVGLDDQGEGINVVAVSNSSNPLDTFEIVRNANDSSRVRIKAPNGFFLQVQFTNMRIDWFACVFC